VRQAPYIARHTELASHHLFQADRSGGEFSFVLGASLHLLLLLAPLGILSFADPVDIDVSLVAFLVLSTVFFVVEFGAATRHRGGPVSIETYAPRGADRLAPFTGLAILVTFWTAMLEHARSDHAPFCWSHASACAVTIVGIALRYLAFARLGVYFRTEIATFRGQALVQHGIYRFMRHPSESGTLAIVLGECALLDSLVGFLLWATVLLPAVLLRVHREDRFLERAFGGRYRAYARCVKRLCPFVY